MGVQIRAKKEQSDWDNLNLVYEIMVAASEKL